MTIQYFIPLSRGWARMTKALFNPFDMKKWFVVGFTAFLAGLTDCHGNGGSGWQTRRRVDWYDVLYFPLRAWEWLLDHPWWLALILVGVCLILILVLVLTWLSSRGKFMFLDNVVHDRAHVSKPWYEFREQGNSLFFWRFCFGFCVVGIIILYLVQCYAVILGLYESDVEMTALIAPAILMGLGLVCIVLLSSFVELLVADFVVPIMYKYRVKTLKAIGLFLKLFSSHFFYFVGYGLLILLLTVVISIGIVIACLLTCCIGFLFLIVPYINAVVLLPISYWLRAFSVEFLEQFGVDYQVFPRPEAVPADARATAP